MATQLDYSKLPGRGDYPLSCPSRSVSLRGFDGPSYRAGHDVPCHVCEATGVVEDGERVDVDVFLDCLCEHCGGSGVEPWRPAGERDTSNPNRDALTNPRKGHWSVTQPRARSLKGRPLARLRMIEAAIRCDLACREALNAWRQAAVRSRRAA